MTLVAHPLVENTPPIIAPRPAVSPRLPITLGAACILGVTLLFAYTPLHGPGCLFKMVFHLPCPGCGMTRSLMALWHGLPVLSFRYHPLGPVLFAGCCAALFSSALRGWRPAAAVHRALSDCRLLLPFAVALLAAWLVRLAFVLAGSRWFLW